MRQLAINLQGAEGALYVGDDDARAAVGFESHCAVVDLHPVVPVVEGLEPVVVELKVPVIAFGWHELDDQGLVGREPPVALEVEEVRVALGLGDVQGKSLVGVLLEVARPAGEDLLPAPHYTGARDLR